MEKLKILQIGEEPWDADLITPDNIEWLYCNGNAIQIFLEKLKSKELEKNNVEYIGKTSTNEVKLWFNAVILTSEVSELQLNLLSDCLEAHTLFYDEDFQLDFCSENGIFKRKVLRPLPFNGSRKEKIIFLSRTLFSEQYGAKLKVSDIDLNPDFKGEIIYEGNSSICFSGNFGEDFQPLFSFRYNLSSTDKAIEIWQEYQKLQGDNSIMIEVIQYQKGSLDLILNTK
ncbi:accessory Sec system protein Asp2, partial [Streptococcus agalactiae]|nr:accessory Sec system protein Asp2 [Streptococcus agalactiae]